MNRPFTELCSNRIVPIAGWLVVTTGACGLLGWILNNPYLKGHLIGGITIKTNTTLALIALGTSLLLLRPATPTPKRIRLARACAAVAVLIGLLTLGEHVFGVDLGIDQLFFAEPPGEPATASPNRMGPPGCLSVMLGGAGLLALSFRRDHAAQCVAIGIAVIAAIPTMGYAYDIAPLYGISRYTGIALHTALALLAFALGLFVVRPATAIMTTLSADYAGGVMARRLLLPALLLPFLIGWVRTLGERMGLIDPALGRPLLIIILTLILVSLILRNARNMSALEQQRLAAEREKAAELARQAQVTEEARAAAVIAREQAERANRAKTEFLATLSHEMRTPLSPVLLTLSALESHPGFPDALRPDLVLMRQNLELETRLISDLLDLTRIERQKLVLDRTDVDLHQVLHDTVALCTGPDRVRSAPVILDLQAARHWVNGDDIRLRQIFWNLLDNALKFTPTSGTISIRTDNSDAGRIRVRIADTGAGFSKEMEARLFHAFEQASSLQHAQHGGLGLGLSIARRLAEVHGGAINAFSDGEGRGATFAVELPVLATPPAAAAPAQVPSAAAPTGPLRILLVEDHASTLFVLNKLLSNLGHQVTTATCVAEATRLAQSNAFDVLLSDLGLPDGSGHELVARIGSGFAGRTIALSGYGSEADVRNSHEHGFAVHLTKPVDLPAIVRALRTVTNAAPKSSPDSQVSETAS